MIAIAARYGFKTSDNDFDGAIWAFTYGAVTLGGLFGHALGVRAWRNSKLVGALVFAGSALPCLLAYRTASGRWQGAETSSKRSACGLPISCGMQGAA